MRIAAFFIGFAGLVGCASQSPVWNTKPWPSPTAACEDLAFDDAGGIWAIARFEDADWLARWAASDPSAGFKVVRQMAGQPHGMYRRPDGGLIIADASGRIGSIDPRGALTMLAERVGGERFGIVNGIAVAPDGTVYFTESSRRHQLEQITAASLLRDDSGRLLRIDPKTKQVVVIADGFVFANGVAVVEGGNAVLVAETFARRITKVYVGGPRNGEREVWIDHLPGYPDNLDADDRGLVWVAIYAEHEPGLDVIRSIPMLPELLVHPVRAAETVKGGRFEPKAVGRILAYDTNGRLVHDLRDPHTPFAPLTSVRARGDKIYLVAPSAKPSIGVMDRP